MWILVYTVDIVNVAVQQTATKGILSGLPGFAKQSKDHIPGVLLAGNRQQYVTNFFHSLIKGKWEAYQNLEKVEELTRLIRHFP